MPIKMKLSDYIVHFFVERGITDFFGYQGTMIAHFVDSIGKNKLAHNHVCYNEQGAAFAACGYASTSEKCGVGYATSGPGALNMISGIANAYYDSIPTVFIMGQINTFEYYKDLPNLRQAGFQETKTVEICRPISKYAVQVTEPSQIRYELEKAYFLATTGRKGPVVLDLPMNIQSAEIEPDKLIGYKADIIEYGNIKNLLGVLKNALQNAHRPVLLLGRGIASRDYSIFIDFAQVLRIPIVTSLVAKGCISYDHELNFGYLGGAYGHRYANMIVSGKSDLIIAIGCSLCTRQTGTKVENFAPDAKVIRFDIDVEELKRKIKPNEQSFLLDTAVLADLLKRKKDEWKKWDLGTHAWVNFCKRYKKFAEDFDKQCEQRYPNYVVDMFNSWVKPEDIIVCDVGQHMMWVAQSLHSKGTQKFLFSGGHGAMGFALPAAMGASAVYPQRTIYCFCGDGAMQMNIQELQWLKREQRNIVIVVFNNRSLGLITQQQDAYFGQMHFGASEPDYVAPSFSKIANAYGIDSVCITKPEEISHALSERRDGAPFLLEFAFDRITRAYPKTVLGKEIYNQEPLMPQKELQNYLHDSCVEN